MPNYAAPNTPGVCAVLNQLMSNPTLQGKQQARLLLCASDDANSQEYSDKKQVYAAASKLRDTCSRQDGQAYGGTSKIAETMIWQGGPTAQKASDPRQYLVVDNVVCSERPCV